MEIKFKIINKDTRRLIALEYLTPNGEWWCETFFDNSKEEAEEGVFNKFKHGVASSNNIRCQYTGIKDKNGEELYNDCDIFTFDLLVELHKEIQLVGVFSWNDDELRYEIDVYNNPEYICLSYISNGIMRNFKKIGNIHTNPELIK